MTERMDIHDFAMQFDGIVDGYVFREGETHPENYAELLAFMYRRFGIDDEIVTAAGLEEAILNGACLEGSCSPGTDVSHAMAVILIGQLSDPDGYVASLPADPVGVMLPPSKGVQVMLSEST